VIVTGCEDEKVGWKWVVVYVGELYWQPLTFLAFLYAFST